jgi:hypothetical protein
MRNIVRFEVEGGPRTRRQAVKATLKYGNDVKHCYSFLFLNLGGPEKGRLCGPEKGRLLS